MVVKFENGFFLSEKQIEDRIAECDCLLPIQHGPIRASEAQTISESIVKAIEHVRGKVIYAHCYERQGVTNLLVKYPPGMERETAFKIIVAAVQRTRGVRGIKQIN